MQQSKQSNISSLRLPCLETLTVKTLIGDFWSLGTLRPLLDAPCAGLLWPSSPHWCSSPPCHLKISGKPRLKTMTAMLPPRLSMARASTTVMHSPFQTTHWPACQDPGLNFAPMGQSWRHDGPGQIVTIPNSPPKWLHMVEEQMSLLFSVDTTNE